MEEKWVDLHGYDCKCQVSNKGRVRTLNANRYLGKYHRMISIEREHYIKPSNNGNGYLYVTLRIDGKRVHRYVHRLVAENFLEKESGKDVVNHIDFDKTNNCVENLEWCTQKENIYHSVDNMKKPKGVSYSNTGEKYITKRKNRYCLTIKGVIDRRFCTLEEAIAKREEVLNEIGVSKR